MLLFTMRAAFVLYSLQVPHRLTRDSAHKISFLFRSCQYDVICSPFQFQSTSDIMWKPLHYQFFNLLTTSLLKESTTATPRPSPIYDVIYHFIAIKKVDPIANCVLSTFKLDIIAVRLHVCLEIRKSRGLSSLEFSLEES